jgi:hypothetical protein
MNTTFLKNKTMILTATLFMLFSFVAIFTGFFISYFSTALPLIIMAVIVFSSFTILRKHLILILLVWINIQNSLIPYLYSHTDYKPIVWTIIITLPFIIPVLFTLFWVVKKIVSKDKVFPKWFVVGVIYSIFSTIFIFLHISNGNLTGMLTYLRALFVPFVYVVVGFIYTNGSKEKLKTMLRIMSIISILGAIFSVIDYYYITPEFWASTVGLGKYWLDVKLLDSRYVLNGELPLNFYTNSGDIYLRRAISFYGDPLAAGYSIATGLIAWLMLRLGFTKKKKNRFITLTVLGILVVGISFTYTRAAYIIIFIALMYLLLFSKSFRKLFPKIGYVLIIGILFFFGGKYITDSLHGDNSSAVIHTQSVAVIPSLLAHPFGTGQYLFAPEGTYQSFLWTVGIIPTIAFIVWLLTLFPKQKDFTSEIGKGILLALVVSGFISFQMMNTSCSFAWVIVGGVLSLSEIKKNKEQPEQLKITDVTTPPLNI